MDNKFVSDLLVELLLEYNRVSLPCLGSFMGQYKPAYIDGSKIYPPSKQIEFHQNEIWNDERLEKLLAHKQNTSLGEAKEKLAFWIDDVCVTLSKGNIINLPGLGKLTVIYGSTLGFEQAPDINFLSEAFGLQPENAPVSSSASNQTPTNNPAQWNSHNQHNPKYNWLIWVWVSFTILISVFSTLLALVHFRIVDLPETYIEANPWVERYLRPETSEFDESSFVFSDDENLLPIPIQIDNNPVVLDTTEQAPENDTTIIDTTMLLSDSLSMAIADSIRFENESTDLYYIIVNSFSLYDDARAISKKLAQRGYIAQILQLDGDKPYKVSIKHFNTDDEAQAYIAELKDTGSSGFSNLSIEKQAKQ